MFDKQNSELLQILSTNESLEKIVFDAYGFNKETIYSDAVLQFIVLFILYDNFMDRINKIYKSLSN